MLKYITYSLLASSIVVSFSFASNLWNEEVKHVGALKNAMKKGDLTPKIELKNLENTKNLYALGAIGYLKGEVLILNSKPLNTYVVNDEVKHDFSYNKNASFVVYSQVKSWQEFSIPKHIVSRKDLEVYIDEIADDYGIDTEKPFAFLLEGKIKSNSWHVINWDPKEKVHTHQKHVQSGVNDTMENTDVKMLGFYSISHAGIFTHHTTNMHIHFTTLDGKISGHSDDLELGENMILKLPKIN
jgi:hypothetical protein